MHSEHNEFGPGSGRRARPLPLWQTILVLAIVGGVYWLTRERVPGEANQGGQRPAAERSSAKRPSRQRSLPADRIEVGGKPQAGDTQVREPPDDGPPAEATWTVPGVVVRDRDGQVVWRGTLDLTKTIARIESGKRLRFANDGSVFENRERRLPRKDSGYYREYVHPTPGLAGPGPQRVLYGAGGEIYYTADHYRTFTTIRGP